MIIYIDENKKCHVSPSDGLRAFETELITDFFSGKCTAFIESCIYVPQNETYTRSDGKVFKGEMITPWKDSAILAAYQEQYESMLPEMEDMKNALVNELGVNVDG